MAVNSEAMLISALVRTGDYQLLASHGISTAMFHTFTDEMAWVEQMITLHGQTPSKQALFDQYPDFPFERVTDTEHWCLRVIQDHKRQSLIDAMDAAMEYLDDPDEAMKIVERGLVGIQNDCRGVSPDFDLFGDWDEIYRVVGEKKRSVTPSGMTGIPTGLPTFDSISGGIQPGWYGVVAARAGAGKTWTGIKMGVHAALAGYSVTYFSLEQSRFQIATRVHSLASMIVNGHTYDSLDLARGQVNMRQYRQLLLDLEKHQGRGEFFINDSSRGRVGPDTVASLIQTRQPQLVIIDYLTLMKKSTPDWQGVAELSSQCQSIGQQFMVPITALSQVNRGGVGKEPPDLEHLSQADAVGQDADWVLTMARQTPRVYKHKLPKFRHGPSGLSWFVKFSPGTGEYDEITWEDAEVLMEEDREID